MLLAKLKRMENNCFFQDFGVTELNFSEASMIFCLDVESPSWLFTFLRSSIEVWSKGVRMDTMISLKSLCQCWFCYNLLGISNLKWLKNCPGQPGYVQMKFQLSPPGRACQVLLSFIGILNLRNGPVSIKIVTSVISSYPNSAKQRDLLSNATISILQLIVLHRFQK